MQGCVAVIFFLGIISPLICRWKTPYLGWLLAIIPASLFLLLAMQRQSIAQGDIISSMLPWLPQLGVNIDFYLDGLSLFFCLLITGIGTLIVIYSYDYLRNHKHIGRYYCYLFLFMGSMLGTVLSNNMVTLFIFWELTGITSYLLISFHHEEASARRAAMQALLVTGAGGLAMLAGFIVLAFTTGQMNISALFAAHLHILQQPLYPVIVMLILLGAFTKSAQYPFHFWLPNAMQAPTPISAYLHSATMVKLGIFLLARFTPILGGSELWTDLLTGFGGITMLVGSVLALRATDLKQILAYSTIMALGTLVFLISSGNPRTMQAAMIFLLAHALYKAGLFLCTGIIDHATGTRELGLLGNLRKKLPFTFVAVTLCAASMAGLPPVIGFITKELIYEAQLAEPKIAFLLICFVIVTNMTFAVIALLFFIKPFFGKDKRLEISATPHEAKFSVWFAPLLLGLLGLFFGIHPASIDSTLLDSALSSILQKPINLNLPFWQGITPPLLLSMMTVILAIIIFIFYLPVHFALKHHSVIYRYTPENLYYKNLYWLNLFSRTLQDKIQTGCLRMYTLIVFLSLFSLVGITFFYFRHIEPAMIIPNAPWFGWFLSLLLLSSAFATVATTRYFASLAFLGVTGMSSTLVFLLYSAPDVAMTQLLVDVLTIIIVVMALYRLPSLPRYQHDSKKLIVRNLIISLLIGGLITGILLCVISTPFDLSTNEFYARYSLALAHGRNIVNVILVDFRAFDTLGEITVVGLAGFGVYTLLKVTRTKEVKQK